MRLILGFFVANIYDTHTMVHFFSEDKADKSILIFISIVSSFEEIP